MLIKATDFKGEVYVKSTLEVHGSATELQYFIDKYAPQLLLFALGKDLFDTLKTYLDVAGTILPTAPQEWLDFSEKAKQPLLYYVFWHYYKNDNSQLVLNAKNVTIADVSTKLATVWNEFLRLYQSNICMVEPFVYISVDGVFIDWFGGNIDNTEPSLIKFIQDTFDYKESGIFRNTSRSNSLGI